MRSLSMPNNLDKLIHDIQDMEERIAKKSVPTVAANNNADLHSIRSVDCLKETLEEEEEEDQFFLPFDDDNDPSNNEEGPHVTQSTQTSFLPDFGAFDPSDEPETIESRVETAPLPTLPKVTATTKPELSELELQALSCLSEIVGVVGVDLSVPPPAQSVETSPSSVMQFGVRLKSPKPASDNAVANPRESGAVVEPERRSIFSRLVNVSAAKKIPSTTSSASMSPNRSSPSSSRRPKKSALKRAGSLYSVSSAQQQSTTSLSSSYNSTASLKRNVSFRSVEIREHDIALSDHPSCSYGPPIQLGWDYRDKAAVTLDDYEQSRSPRRAQHEMVLSYNVRRYLLLKRAGYTKMELQHAMQEVDRVKRERLVTDILLPASKIDETLEDIIDNVRGLFLGGRMGNV